MKIRLFFISVCFALVQLSCTGNSPEPVAKGFLEAMSDYDFEEAKTYCDNGTAGLVGMLESLSKMSDDKEEKKDVSITIISSEINEDKATVTYITDKNSNEQQLLLRKIDGEWKVSMGKEDLKKEQ